MTRDELLKHINDGFHDLMAYLDTLSEADLTTNTDAAGWTVKDHVMHLAVWEDGIWALLNRQVRYEQMGLTQAQWASGDIDEINGIIQQQHRDRPAGEVLQTFRDVHQRLVATLESLTDDDLQRPYNHYGPGETRDAPIIGWVEGNTYEHYNEHRPWIEAIL